MAHKHGDKIHVKGGKCKGRSGIYLGAAGRISARVKLEGDKTSERTLRMSSIEREPKMKKTAHKKATAESRKAEAEEDKEEMVCMKKSDCDAIIEDLTEPQQQVLDMKNRIQCFVNGSDNGDNADA